MKDRIYVCHTYYHAYVAFLKELALPKEARGQATLLLSSMSNDFESFGERAYATGLFEAVLPFDEKREDFFPELAKYRRDRGNIIANTWQRIRFTKAYAKLEAPYIPVDFKQYGEIFVFCDSDPIGYYLNQNHIRYHALEDGLNCLVHFDAARYDNRGHFKWKTFLSNRLNLIFVQNGYGKYCIDMEVNDIAAIQMPCPKYKELPRKQLVESLTQEDKELLLKAFVRDMEGLHRKINQCNQPGADGKVTPKILILTDPLCTLDVRERIFRDIVENYEKQGQIFIKPHPRDELDYGRVFAGYPMFDATMPMEMLNFFQNLRFDTVVTVFTDLKGITFGNRLVRLGDEFMDRYEDPSIHNQNRQIGILEKEDNTIFKS